MTPVIVYVVDETYCCYLAVSLKSLSDQSTTESMKVVVLTCGLTDASKSKLQQCITAKNLHLTFIDCNNIDDSITACGRSYVSKTTFAKILVGDLLPSERFALLLDCDTLIRHDIAILWSYCVSNLQENAIAAVQDFGLAFGHDKLAGAWIDQTKTPYFNAGLLFFDLNRLRDASPRLLSVANDQSLRLPYLEQDVLNLEFANAWLPLPFAWNAQGLGTYASLCVCGPTPLFSDIELQALERDAFVVHFTGSPSLTPGQVLDEYVNHPAKPFSVACKNPFKQEFFDALDRTPWHSIRPSADNAASSCAAEIRSYLPHLQKANIDVQQFFICLQKEIVAVQSNWNETETEII